MKIDKFKQVLKQMIREEVSRAVAEEVNKSMVKLLAEVIQNRPNELSPVGSGVSPIQTKNPKLNEALKNTARNMGTSEVRPASTRVSLSEMFSKIDSNEEVFTPATAAPAPVQINGSSNIGMLKSVVSPEPIGQQSSILTESNVVTDTLFKKDFRTLMRKIDEKKKSGSTGFFPGVSMMPQMSGFDAQ